MSCKNHSTLVSPKGEGEVSHVAFVIHGIGQQTEQYGFFQKHLDSLHRTTQQAADAHSHKTNIQYIPIEWHRYIHDETDDIMNDITMKSIPHLRMVNNDYLADAFFYLSKDRGQAIIHHVTKTFNESYRQFKLENPEFKGKIAILAYSLGGIITWDILCNQKYGNSDPNPDFDFFDFQKLDFKPDYLFTLGSPLSAFLTVRNQNPETYHPDTSIIYENIFHPYDPLAYRFEPLLRSDYKQKPAVMVDRCIEETSLLQKVIDWYNTALEDSCKGSFLSFITNNSNSSKKRTGMNTKRKRDCMESSSGVNVALLSSKPSLSLSKKRKVVLNETCTRGNPVKSSSSDLLLKRRIDYCLQPDRIWDAIPYIGGLSAHFSYWSHMDLMWHIVKRLDDVNSIECIVKL